MQHSRSQTHCLELPVKMEFQIRSAIISNPFPATTPAITISKIFSPARLIDHQICVPSIMSR